MKDYSDFSINLCPSQAKQASSRGEVLHSDFLTPLILKESMLVLEKFTDIKTVAQGGYPEVNLKKIFLLECCFC